MIAIASDHAGFHLKEGLIEYLKTKQLDFTDLGPSEPESVDYPDYAGLVAEAINSGKAENGILVCGSGEGVCMAANKFSGIRAGLAWNSDIARLIKAHNNANVICFGGRFTALPYAITMLEAFLTASFEGGNHERRVKKLDALG